jgi:hypothetical protein
VKVEGCGYQLSEEELTGWMELYGRVLEPIAEEMLEEEGTGREFGNGRYIVKMKIEREIPELISMFDQRVTIHYGGMKKICKSCYLYHRDQCQNKR